jgi:hypothetical protein
MPKARKRGLSAILEVSDLPSFEFFTPYISNSPRVKKEIPVFRRRGVETENKTTVWPGGSGAIELCHLRYFVDKNPHAAGSRRAGWFAKLKTRMTVADAVKAGVPSTYLARMAAGKIVKIG